MPHPLFERHRALLERAVQAIHERSYWSAFPESASPKVYGEGAAEAGKAEFDALLTCRFPLTQPATVGDVGGERSPFGIPLGVTYPKPDIDGLFAAVGRAHDQWRKADPETWAGVCLEILVRINKASFAMANAVMHTTGQAFLMAFQAGGPHAQDRGLEAVAYAWDELVARAALGAVGEAAGQERADPHGEALSRRPARRRARRRLLHVSDVERLSGTLREPRDGQRGRRQAASGRDPAARDDRAHRTRGARRSGHRSERRHAVRARGRQQRRAAARAAARSRASSTSPAAARTAAGSRSMRARRRCTPRRRA